MNEIIKAPRKRRRQLTICLAVIRKARKANPIRIVCHDHCKNFKMSKV